MAKVVKIPRAAKVRHKEVRTFPVEKRQEWESFISWMRECLIGRIQYMEIVGEKIMTMTVYFSKVEDRFAFCLQFPD